MCGDRAIVILFVIFSGVFEAKHTSHSHKRSKNVKLESSSIQSSKIESTHSNDEYAVLESGGVSSELSHSVKSYDDDWSSMENYDSYPYETDSSEDLLQRYEQDSETVRDTMVDIMEQEHRRHQDIPHKIETITGISHHHRPSHHKDKGNRYGGRPSQSHDDGIVDTSEPFWAHTGNHFCKEALEEEEPFMVNDGAFHPRYEEVPGVGVYRLHARARSWAEARKVCEREGAQLAVPNSPEEAHALADIHNRCPRLLDTHFNDYQYLGVHDDYNEGRWETVVGYPLNETGYMNWAYNQPDNAHHYGENCLTMNRHKFYNDVPCWTKLPFICEHS